MLFSLPICCSYQFLDVAMGDDGNKRCPYRRLWHLWLVPFGPLLGPRSAGQGGATGLRAAL